VGGKLAAFVHRLWTIRRIGSSGAFPMLPNGKRRTVVRYFRTDQIIMRISGRNRHETLRADGVNGGISIFPMEEFTHFHHGVPPIHVKTQNLRFRQFQSHPPPHKESNFVARAVGFAGNSSPYILH
jgi:hypothetical protein